MIQKDEPIPAYLNIGEMWLCHHTLKQNVKTLTYLRYAAATNALTVYLHYGSDVLYIIAPRYLHTYILTPCYLHLRTYIHLQTMLLILIIYLQPTLVSELVTLVSNCSFWTDKRKAIVERNRPWISYYFPSIFKFIIIQITVSHEICTIFCL